MRSLATVSANFDFLLLNALMSVNVPLNFLLKVVKKPSG